MSSDRGWLEEPGGLTRSASVTYSTVDTTAFKAGSTLPVKFQLTGGSAGIGDLTARLLVSNVANGVSGTEAEAVATTGADSGNVVRYDAAAKQYVFNLSTKGFTDGTYQLRIDPGDSVVRTVNVSTKK